MENTNVFIRSGTQYDEMRPTMGTMTMRMVLSQLTCWYQFFQVIGMSVM